VDKKEPGHSSKLEALDELLEQLLDEDDRKIVLFSEWTSMLDLVEPLLEKQGAPFVRLDGSVPQKKREQLVQQFHDDEDCRLFITTNAGSTGLNLQCANTVINVDLPWNPAVLEQRIARAHRMGQQRQVQVFVLVTEDTLEEKLLATLSAKHELALAALDPESDLDQVDFSSGVEDLKRRLTTLLGEKPAPPNRDNNVAAAGGQLISAAFQFIGEMVPDSQSSREMTDALRERLAECVEHDESGQPRLTVTLPDRASLDQIAEAIGRIMAATKSQT
jgi:superfamily II DNA/RNA helicase